MKKLILLTAFLILGAIKSQAQVNPDSLIPGVWINPINDIPFITQVAIFNPMDSFFLGDSIPWIFNGDPIYTYDSLTNYVPNGITAQNYVALFGPTAQPLGNPPIDLLVELFYESPVNTQLIIDQSEWNSGVWDTILFPWITNRTITSTSLSMGVQVAWNWSDHPEEALETILSPTVPVLKGEDFDYVSSPVNFALDNLDSVDLATKIQIAEDYNVYVYSLEEFQEVYDAFILSLFNNQNFYPQSYDFDDFHDWLLAYLTNESIYRIQLLSINEYSPDNFHLVKQSKNHYSYNYDHAVYGYEIYNAQGVLLNTVHEVSDPIISIPNLSTGLLFIRFKTEQGFIVKKLIP